MDYEVVIGLEVHTQLMTKTKLFCSCSTEFGKDCNTNGCPICLGHPGTLPVLNEKAVELAVRMGLATNHKINEVSIFARKNYFYPDLPKGYQVSQYDKPICEHGSVSVMVDGQEKIVGITRIHLEEDAGKLKHDGEFGGSLFDVNRSGMPLVEIVSDPSIRSSKEAYSYLVKLRQILQYTDVCDGSLEEGSMRCDANISLRPFGQEKFGTRTEVKNLNSFKNVQRAIDYEVARQSAILDAGGKIVQETLLWDAEKGVARSMRGKEDAHDYRYFPEPDLPPLVVTRDMIEKIKREMPELPENKIKRFVSDYGLPVEDCEILCLTKARANYFEDIVKNFGDHKQAANWMMTEILRVLNEMEIDIEQFKVKPVEVAELLSMVKDGKISGKIAKVVFKDMIEVGGKPSEIVEKKGLVQISDESAIVAEVENIIKEFPKEVELYLGGKDKLFGHFVGQLMQRTKGKANPQTANRLIKEKLEQLRNQLSV